MVSYGFSYGFVYQRVHQSTMADGIILHDPSPEARSGTTSAVVPKEGPPGVRKKKQRWEKLRRSKKLSMIKWY